MYDTDADPYCYPDTPILKNKRGLRNQAALDAFEAVMSAQRADEPLPGGRLSARHYCAIHRHLFGDIYAWAGRYRTVRLMKGSATFCYPEYIAAEMKKLFAAGRQQNYYCGLSPDRFAVSLAHFLSALNAIHPFREGNGRCQLTFAALIASRAGYALDLEKLEPKLFLDAMIASFGGNEAPLCRELKKLVTPT